MVCYCLFSQSSWQGPSLLTKCSSKGCVSFRQQTEPGSSCCKETIFQQNDSWGWRDPVITIPSEHLHDTSKCPTLWLASNQGIQPFKLVYFALVIFSSLHVMVFRSLQSNQATAETQATPPSKLPGADGGMGGSFWLLFPKYLKHLDIFLTDACHPITKEIKTLLKLQS